MWNERSQAGRVVRTWFVRFTLNCFGENDRGDFVRRPRPPATPTVELLLLAATDEKDVFPTPQIF